MPLDVRDLSVFTFFREDGKFWMGTVLGLYTYSGGKIHKETELNRQLEEKSVYGILRDRQGKLWVGTCGWGVKVFDRNRRVAAELNTDMGFPDGSVNALFEDSRGGVWIATRAGLGYVRDTRRPDSFLFYGHEHGLEDVFIRSVQEDSHGRIWVSTNNGISHWDERKQRFENYDYRDGVPMGNLVERSACRGADGTLYFGSMKGICCFNPLGLDTMSRRAGSVQIIECREWTAVQGEAEN